MYKNTGHKMTTHEEHSVDYFPGRCLQINSMANRKNYD